jgi:ADP-heptose:LPS heptosyltransferase
MAQMQIVALLFRRVGDSLMATPALRAVKQQFADSRLAVIAEPQVTRVFEHNPWIDEIRTIGNSPAIFTLSAEIRRNGTPDAALDFLSDPRSALACLLSRAKRRVGFERRGRSRFYTDRIARQDAEHPMYSAAHKLALAEAIGAESTDTGTEFYLTEADREYAAAMWKERGWNENTNLVAFFVSSRREHKRWPISAFCEVIARMSAEKNYIPLILATPGDESAVAEVRSGSQLPAANVIPVNNLGQLGAVQQRCRLLVGNDGGPKHIAVALHVPTVTIFAPGSAAHWTPLASPDHVAISPDNPQSTIADVAPADVYTAAIAMLRRPAP